MFLSRKKDAAVDQNQSGDVRGFKRLLAHMDRLGSSTLLTAVVQLAGLSKRLDHRKSAEGEAAARVASVAEAEIHRRLSSSDHFSRLDKGYLLSFGHTNSAAAEQTAADISAGISRELSEALGKDEGNPIDIPTFVAPVPTAEFRSAVSIPEALYAALDRMRSEAQVAAQSRPADRALLHASVLYQPVWPRHEQHTVHNRSVLDPISGSAILQVAEGTTDRHVLADVLTDLDCVILSKSVDGLHEALKASRSTSVIVPVQFNTLAGRHAERLLALGRTIPSSYRRSIALEIVGVPTAADQRQLVEVAQAAQDVSARLVLQLSPLDPRLDAPLRTMIWGLSSNLQDFPGADAALTRTLVRFTAACNEMGLCSFAFGVNTLGRAVAAVKAEFDHLAGTAVHHTVAVQRPHGRFSPLFGDLIRKLRKNDPGAARRAHPRFVPLNPNAILTLPGGKREPARIIDLSATGAALEVDARPAIGSVVAVGSLPARVIRQLPNGFAVAFMKVQSLTTVEAALLAPFQPRRAALHSPRPARGWIGRE